MQWKGTTHQYTNVTNQPCVHQSRRRPGAAPMSLATVDMYVLQSAERGLISP